MRTTIFRGDYRKTNSSEHSNCWNCAEQLNLKISSPAPKYDVIGEIKKIVIKYQEKTIPISEAVNGILYAYYKYLNGPTEEETIKKLLENLYGLYKRQLVDDSTFEKYKQLLHNKLDSIEELSHQEQVHIEHEEEIFNENDIEKQKWVPVKHSNSKIGGLLILVGIFLVRSIVGNSIGVYNDLSALLNKDLKLLLGTNLDHAVRTTLTYIPVELSVNLLALIASSFAFYIFITKKKLFKIIFISYIALEFILKISLVNFLKSTPVIYQLLSQADIQHETQRTFKLLPILIVVVIYVLLSKRVKETFVN